MYPSNKWRQTRKDRDLTPAELYKKYKFKPRLLSKKELDDFLKECAEEAAIISNFRKGEEEVVDIFQPASFEEYVGQEDAKEILKIISKAAEKEQRSLPNLLITGSAGLGKTTLGKILLKDEEYTFADGNSVNTTYANLEGYAIIDEIHNVKPEICDSLNVILDQNLLRIIGCTTNPGMLPSPFRSRFRTINLIPYAVENLIDIMQNVLVRKKTQTVDRPFLEQIAIRSRQTPRTALKTLSFMMDIMVVNEAPSLTKEIFDRALGMIGMDSEGLLPIDRRYLDAFPDNGQAVGLQYLSAVTGIDKETIEEEIEPYLMNLKRLNRSSRGRVLVR